MEERVKFLKLVFIRYIYFVPTLLDYLYRFRNHIYESFFWLRGKSDKNQFRWKKKKMFMDSIVYLFSFNQFLLARLEILMDRFYISDRSILLKIYKINWYRRKSGLGQTCAGGWPTYGLSFLNTTGSWWKLEEICYFRKRNFERI